MIDASGIALIFLAQQALGIGGLRHQFGCRNRFRVFFRFGQIDGNVQIAVFGRSNPFDVFCNTVSADIIGILRELIEPIGRALRVLVIQKCKVVLYLTRRWRQRAHQLGVKQIPIHHTVLFERAGLQCAVAQIAQNISQTAARRLLRRYKRVRVQDFQQAVDRPHAVCVFNQPCALGVVHQRLDAFV